MGFQIKYYPKILNTKKMLMILLMGLSSFSVLANTHSNRIRVLNVIIFGESNMMDFWLKYDAGASRVTKQSHNYDVAESENSVKLFELPVESFTASNKQIKKDFVRMMRSDVSPNIYIRFDEAFYDQVPEKDKPLLADILIEIGGVEKLVSAEYVSNCRYESGQVFKGTLSIRLSDFDLVPPKHLFGLFKVKETIMITFEVEVLSR